MTLAGLLGDVTLRSWMRDARPTIVSASETAAMPSFTSENGPSILETAKEFEGSAVVVMAAAAVAVGPPTQTSLTVTIVTAATAARQCHHSFLLFTNTPKVFRFHRCP